MKVGMIQNRADLFLQQNPKQKTFLIAQEGFSISLCL